MMNPRARAILRTAVVIAGVALAYFGTARLLVAVSAPPNGAVTTVWLPSGLSVAMLLVFGPVAAVGALFGSVWFEISAGTPGAAAVIVGMANAGSELLCFYLIVGRAKREFSVEYSRDVWRLLWAAMLGAAASASVGVTVYVIFAVVPPAEYWRSWVVWFGSTGIGIVLLTPLVVYSVKHRRPLGGLARYAEFAVALSALATSSFLLQEPVLSTIAQDLMVAISIMVFIWIVFRFAPREMTTAVAVFTFFAISGVILRRNPEARMDTYLATFSLQLLLGGTGMIAYFLSSIVAQQNRSNDDLRLASTIYETTSEGIMVTTPSGDIASVNDSFGRITGYARADILGKNPRFMKSDRHSQEFFKQMWDTLFTTGAWQGEVWNRRADGSLLPTWLSLSSVKNQQGAVTEFVGVYSDITAIKRGEEDLQWLATHDPLTRLPNRTLLEDRLTTALARSRRQRSSTAVFFFDLDHFKDVNDTLGHPAGDSLLVEIARRCLAVLRETDTLGRSGGDEFSIVVTDYLGTEDLSLLASRILAAVDDPVTLGEHEARVTASIGIAKYPEDGTDATALAEHADVAMYRAKELGRNRFEFFSPPPQS